MGRSPYALEIELIAPTILQISRHEQACQGHRNQPQNNTAE